MVCDSVAVGATKEAKEAREKQIREDLANLEKLIRQGDVMVVVDRASGAVAFKGWKSGAKINDACAYRRLTVAGSNILKVATLAAETRAGRKVNMSAVSSGMHSHDGGKTWHPGH